MVPAPVRTRVEIDPTSLAAAYCLLKSQAQTTQPVINSILEVAQFCKNIRGPSSVQHSRPHKSPLIPIEHFSHKSPHIQRNFNLPSPLRHRHHLPTRNARHRPPPTRNLALIFQVHRPMIRQLRRHKFRHPNLINTHHHPKRQQRTTSHPLNHPIKMPIHPRHPRRPRHLMPQQNPPQSHRLCTRCRQNAS